MARARTPIINKRVRFMPFPSKIPIKPSVGERARPLDRWALDYCMELATLENTLLALEPIKRMVPTTITRITASITAYSAISCPSCSHQSLRTSFLSMSFFLLDRRIEITGMVVREPRLGPKRDSRPPPDRVIIPCILGNSDKFLHLSGNHRESTKPTCTVPSEGLDC